MRVVPAAHGLPSGHGAPTIRFSAAMRWPVEFLRPLAMGVLLAASVSCLGATTYTYDSVGRLTGANDGIGTLISYTYDKAGNMLSQTVTKVAVATTLDVDGSVTQTKYDALTDGLLLLRYMFGLTGPALTAGALGSTATRADGAAMKAYLDGAGLTVDIDGDGRADALTDGLLVMRYLFGLRGPALIAGAVSSQATRKTAADIATYIQSLLP